MKLHIVNPQDAHPHRVGLLVLAFETLQRELKLTKIDSTVNVTVNVPMDKHVGARVNVSKRDPYKVEICQENNTSRDELLMNFAHEMVHVADIVHGRAVIGLDGDGGVQSFVYDGKHITPEVQFLARRFNIEEFLPYEKEAYGRQGPLVLAILKDLPEVARDYVGMKAATSLCEASIKRFPHEPRPA